MDLRSYRDGANPRNANLIELGADFAAAIHSIPKEDLLSQEAPTVSESRIPSTLRPRACWNALSAFMLRRPQTVQGVRGL